jgi:hypothetical protein
MITTGVTGGRWRASVSEWGAIEPWDDTPPLDWYVAADDRWHVPAREPAVRQRRIDGTPVVETRVRVPNGDVVHTVYSCADLGGVTVVDVLNDSPLPVAVAFDRRDLLTERPIADVPIEGIDLPAGSFVLPLGHRARLRVGLLHGAQRAGALPPQVPATDQVVRGWLSHTERASRLVVPDVGLVERVTQARCEIALEGLPASADDPAAFLVALHELVRMGEPAGAWVHEAAAAVEIVGPVSAWDADAALRAAARVLAAADERRAVDDVTRIIVRRTPSTPPDRAPEGGLCIPWLESRFAGDGMLFPFGFAAEWVGQSVEAHGVPTGPRTQVSTAIRWHGDRPAVLWEQSGTPIELTAPVVAPGWSTTEPTGETLWPVPPPAISVECRPSSL